MPCSPSEYGSSRRANGHQGTPDLATWEARLNAREEELKRREDAISAVEGQLGVKAAQIVPSLILLSMR